VASRTFSWLDKLVDALQNLLKQAPPLTFLLMPLGIQPVQGGRQIRQAFTTAQHGHLEVQWCGAGYRAPEHVSPK